MHDVKIRACPYGLQKKRKKEKPHACASPPYVLTFVKKIGCQILPYLLAAWNQPTKGNPSIAASLSCSSPQISNHHGRRLLLPTACHHGSIFLPTACKPSRPSMARQMDLARPVETQPRWPDGSNVLPLTRSISTTTPDGKQHGGACSSHGWVSPLLGAASSFI